MSMDALYDEMRQFCSALILFNEHLAASMQALAEQHEAVNPHWQDEMRRMYDRHWQPLEDAMSHYLLHASPQYLEFLERKLIYMGDYLYGQH